MSRKESIRVYDSLRLSAYATFEQEDINLGWESERDSMHPKYVCYNTTNQKQTRCIPSHGNGSAMPVEFGAPRTEVTAPSFFEERDAQAI